MPPAREGQREELRRQGARHAARDLGQQPRCSPSAPADPPPGTRARPLFAEEVFGLAAAARGAAFAVGEAAAVLGLIVATPSTARFLAGPAPERVFLLLAIRRHRGGCPLRRRAHPALQPDLGCRGVLAHLNAGVVTGAFAAVRRGRRSSPRPTPPCTPSHRPTPPPHGSSRPSAPLADSTSRS